MDYSEIEKKAEEVLRLRTEAESAYLAFEQSQKATEEMRLAAHAANKRWRDASLRLVTDLHFGLGDPTPTFF